MTSHNSVIQGRVHTQPVLWLFCRLLIYNCLTYGCRLGHGRLELGAVASPPALGLEHPSREIWYWHVCTQNLEHVCWFHALFEAIGYLCRCRYPVDTVSSFWVDLCRTPAAAIEYRLAYGVELNLQPFICLEPLTHFGVQVGYRAPAI